MSTRSGLIRQSLIETSPQRTRKGVSPTRSPARKRSSPISRSSQKSPSRKSPSRKPASKYPARKSPSRAVKQHKEEKVSPSPTKRPTIKQDSDVKQVNVSSKIEILRTTRARRSEYPIKDISSSISKTETILSENLNGLENIQTLSDIYELRHRRVAEDTELRRSSRLKDFDNAPDIRRSFSKSLSKSISKSISMSVDAYSDEEISDDKLKEKSHSVSRKLATPLPSAKTLAQINDKFDFHGKIGTCIFYILIPIIVFYILLSCYNSCAPKTLKDLSSYKLSSLWLEYQTSIIVIAQYIFQALLVCSPIFGTKELDKQGRKYCFNAFFSSICTIIALISLIYYNVLHINIFLGSYLQMASVSYIIAVFLAIVLYVKSFYNDDDLNSYGTSGYIIHDFFMGRKTHDRLMKLNIKLWLARTSNITTLIFTMLIFKNGFHIQETKQIDFTWESLKEIHNKVKIQPTIFVYSMMQMVYILYFITREKIITSTFYWHSEGLGYLQIVSSALYPYLFTSISKYVVDTELSMSIYALTAAVTIYLLGLLLMLISNNIKYEFRKNPLQPKLMYLESMPTFHGKKLLTSHVWGLLRHPNYTGDILIHIALMLPGVLTHQILASAPALIAIVVLLHRSWRDHKRCRRRYGAAWQRYCVKVPSVIIPKIF